MRTRQELERNPHWQGTFEVQTGGKRGKVICLMREAKGGFYWFYPDDSRLLVWGATAAFSQSGLTYDLAHGYLRLVAGAWPPTVRPFNELAGTDALAAVNRSGLFDADG